MQSSSGSANAEANSYGSFGFGSTTRCLTILNASKAEKLIGLFG